eukprot:UN13971
MAVYPLHSQPTAYRARDKPHSITPRRRPGRSTRRVRRPAATPARAPLVHGRRKLLRGSLQALPQSLLPSEAVVAPVQLLRSWRRCGR